MLKSDCNGLNFVARFRRASESSLSIFNRCLAGFCRARVAMKESIAARSALLLPPCGVARKRIECVAFQILG